MSLLGITVAGLGGPSGNAIVKALQQSKGATSDPKFGSPSFAIEKAEFSIFEAIRRNQFSPPVIFYCNMLDTWSMRGKLIDDLKEKCLTVLRDKAVVTVVAIKSRQAKRVAKTLRRAKPKHSTAEERLFSQIVTDCALTVSRQKSGVMFIRFELKGACLGDDEIASGCKGISNWVQKIISKTQPV